MIRAATAPAAAVWGRPALPIGTEAREQLRAAHEVLTEIAMQIFADRTAATGETGPQAHLAHQNAG